MIESLRTFVVDQYDGTRIPLCSPDAAVIVGASGQKFAAVMSRSVSFEQIMQDFKPTWAPRTVATDRAYAVPFRTRVGMTLLRNGGGVETITVQYAHRRPNREDGQYFAYLFLMALSQTYPCTLVHGDTVLEDCWFLSGTATVRPIVRDGRPASIVTGSLTFERPMSSRVLPYSASGEEPSPWPPVVVWSRPETDGQWYAVGGRSRIKLGLYADIASVSVSRRSAIRLLPRLVGARLNSVGYSAAIQSFDGRRGRQCTLTMNVWIRADRDPRGARRIVYSPGVTMKQEFWIQSDMEALYQALGDSPWYLSGPGIRIGPAFLSSIEMSRTARTFMSAMLTVTFNVDCSVVVDTPAAS